MAARSSPTRFRAPRLRSGPGFTEAIKQMQNGALLKLEYMRGAPCWSLGDGLPVSPETVSLLLANKEIEAAGDVLFDGAASQTWRLRGVK
jgi:hypothetical protein